MVVQLVSGRKSSLTSSRSRQVGFEQHVWMAKIGKIFSRDFELFDGTGDFANDGSVAKKVSQ